MKIRTIIGLLWIPLWLWGTDVKCIGNKGIPVHAIERVFVHTDRDIYIAGETIFFKLYIINEGSHRLSEISNIANLMIRSSTNNTIAKIRIKVEHGLSNGSIFLPDTLSSGTYQLIGFTNWMRNSGEEGFFNKEIFIANRFDKDLTTLNTFSGPTDYTQANTLHNTTENNTITIKTDKTEYAKHEKININGSLPDDGDGDLAYVSVSVYEEVPGLGNPLSIRDFLSNNQNQTVHPTLESATVNFLPELKGEIIQGIVFDLDTKKGVSRGCVFLSVQDTVVNLQYNYTDNQGKFRFRLSDYYYGKDLVLSIKDNPVDRKLKIILDDPFKLTSNFKPVIQNINPKLKEYIIKSQDIVTIQKVYQVVNTTDIKKQVNSMNLCPRVYDKPYVVVKTADFIPLMDFFDINRELMPTFKLRKHNNVYHASLGDDNLHEFMDQDPVIFLDGVYIHDINQIISFGSDKIKKIELVNTRYNFGEIVFPGILAVFSKNNEIKNIQPTPETIHAQIEAFQGNSSFTQHLEANESKSHQPDFRQVLYWCGDLEFSGDHFQIPEFYASDHSGVYTIRIEGINSDGVPLSAIAKIKVK